MAVNGARYRLLAQSGPEFRLAVVLALSAARSAGSTEINQEHLLVGLVAEPAGLAGRLLGALNVDTAALSSELRAKLGPVNVAEQRPILGGDSAKAIRSAQRHASRSGQVITPAHLLLALSQPFAGWSRKALKKTGVTFKALKMAHQNGVAEHHPGLDAAAVDWMWDYLPQSGRHIVAGDHAQAGGDLPAAIASFELALQAAKEDDLVAGHAGDVYPKLIQANLLAGEIGRAVEWLDEADRFLTSFEFADHHIVDEPDIEGNRLLIRELEVAATTYLSDLRLQLLKDRAEIHMGRDDFQLANEAAQALIDVGEGSGHHATIAAGRNLVGTALACTGEDDDAAERHLVASREPVDFIQPVDMAARTYSLARLFGFRGDHTAAAELASQAEARYADLGLQRSVAAARLLKAEAEVALGGTMPPMLLDDTIGVDPNGKAQMLAWALLVKAQSESRQNPEAAREVIEQAITISSEYGHRLTLIRCLLEQGRILGVLGQRQAARDVLERALALSGELGVRFTVDAQRALEALADG